MKPATLFRRETTAAGRTHSYGLGPRGPRVTSLSGTIEETAWGCLQPSRFELHPCTAPHAMCCLHQELLMCDAPVVLSKGAHLPNHFR